MPFNTARALACATSQLLRRRFADDEYFHDGPSHRRASTGSTLVEVLISVILLAIVGIGVITLMATALRGSGVHRDAAGAQARLASAAAVLANDNVPIAACGRGSAAYQRAIDQSPQLQPLDLSEHVQVDSVLYWDGTEFGSSCVVGYRLQQITLSAGTNRSNPADTLTLTKRPAAGVVAG